jgi:hypothetical protein
MRKIILLATMLLVAGSVSAQTYFNNDRVDYNSYYQSNFGFEIAANLSNTTNGPNFNTGNLPGVTAGFNIDLPVAYPLSIVPAILYSMKGYTANTPSGDFTQRSQSIEIPVMARFRSGSAISFYLGPQVSYMVSSTNKFSDNFPTAIRQNYQYSGANLRYQGVAGIGLDITHSINIHARYTFDLQGTNVNANNFVPSYRLQAWQLGLGFNL